MDEQRLTANEDLIDTLGARADELERRLDALLDLLRSKPVLEALGVQDTDFIRMEPSKMPVQVRSMKQSNARHRAVAKLRQDKVLAPLASVSPARLDELLRER